MMEADDRQVTIVFAVQPSFHQRHSTNRLSLRVTIVGERAVTPHLVVRGRWQHFRILGLSSADGRMTVGLWKLSSLDGRRPPSYRHLIMGSTTCSDPGLAVLQPSFRLGKQEKGNSFILLGASFIRTALATTTMTNPSLCFLPSSQSSLSSQSLLSQPKRWLWTRHHQSLSSSSTSKSSLLSSPLPSSWPLTTISWAGWSCHISS